MLRSKSTKKCPKSATIARKKKIFYRNSQGAQKMLMLGKMLWWNSQKVPKSVKIAIIKNALLVKSTKKCEKNAFDG